MNDGLMILIIGSSVVNVLFILVWVGSYIGSSYMPKNEDKVLISAVNLVPLIANIVVITIIGLKLGDLI